MPDEKDKQTPGLPDNYDPAPTSVEPKVPQPETVEPEAPEPISDEPDPPEPVSYAVDQHPDDYHSQHYEAPYTAPYGETTPGAQSTAVSSTELVPVTATSAPPPSPPPPPDPVEDDDDDDEGMLRMSFLEHLEELRLRIIRSLYGLGAAFFLAMAFTQQLWDIVQRPAAAALTSLGYPPYLVFAGPMDAFLIIWFKLPLLVSVFAASPWVLYQVWGFIAPGLYKKERKLAVPFVISTAGLFIMGGLFAYFVAFRFSLTFLLGVGQAVNIRPMITVTDYFDLFVNVILGVGVVFEMPVLVFMLTLLKITTPTFLLRHSRYAILIIVIIAAVITPTPDVYNLMLFSVPMVVLYFIGIFASHLLVRNREGKAFPWGMVAGVFSLAFIVLAACLWLAVTRYGFHFVTYWPFITK